MTGFEIGKRYKTRDGEIVATLIAVGKRALVFETEDRVFVRDFGGLGDYRTHERGATNAAKSRRF